MARPTWNRRRFLRGVGGIVLALPFLESAGPRGAAAAPPPKRFVVMFTANGTVKELWRPTGTETSFTLSPILSPLAPYKDKLVVIDGVDEESSYHGPGDAGHSSAMGHLLTGTELIDVGQGEFWAGGISVDQLIAQRVGQHTQLGSLELCVEDHPASVQTRMCYAGKKQPVPPEADPRAAFQRAFAVVPPELVAKRKSVLDAVSDDIASLRPKLGADDRQRLDQHLAAVRDVETRLPTHGPACTPKEPAAVDPNDFQAAAKLHMDVLALALSCDVTRVASLQFSTARSLTVFPWLALEEQHHDISHQSLDDPAVVQKIQTINTFYAKQMAYLVGALATMDDGDGKLIDRCAVLWANEMSVGQAHNRRAIPYVLAGGCGGAYATGRFLDLTNPKGNPTHNQLLLSLCHAMGVEVQTFGNPAYCPGPLPRLV
ncbi:MAG TPA: DUF1552 domain-containing protein [Minicystis sp.]|nr:DUF1552 domain-containing protein [Minicystis sp.]